jgi:hypothetical protein
MSAAIVGDEDGREFNDGPAPTAAQPVDHEFVNSLVSEIPAAVKWLRDRLNALLGMLQPLTPEPPAEPDTKPIDPGPMGS